MIWEDYVFLVIQAVTFLGWLSDPFKGLSDLQLGDEKGTFQASKSQIAKSKSSGGKVRW